jgi:hypothetical protein
MGQDARVIPREMAAEWLKLAEVFASVMRLKGSVVHLRSQPTIKMRRTDLGLTASIKPML